MDLPAYKRIKVEGEGAGGGSKAHANMSFLQYGEKSAFSGDLLGHSPSVERKSALVMQAEIVTYLGKLTSEQKVDFLYL